MNANNPTNMCRREKSSPEKQKTEVEFVNSRTDAARIAEGIGEGMV